MGRGWPVQWLCGGGWRGRRRREMGEELGRRGGVWGLSSLRAAAPGRRRGRRSPPRGYHEVRAATGGHHGREGVGPSVERRPGEPVRHRVPAVLFPAKASPPRRWRGVIASWLPSSSTWPDARRGLGGKSLTISLLVGVCGRYSSLFRVQQSCSTGVCLHMHLWGTILSGFNRENAVVEAYPSGRSYLCVTHGRGGCAGGSAAVGVGLQRMGGGGCGAKLAELARRAEDQSACRIGRVEGGATHRYERCGRAAARPASVAVQRPTAAARVSGVRRPWASGLAREGGPTPPPELSRRHPVGRTVALVREGRPG